MITEDYVSFETAKLLKEKGFDEYCEKAYISSEAWSEANYEPPYTNKSFNEYFEKDCCTKPTLQMAMKWLRKEHNIHIAVIVAYNHIPRRYEAHIMKLENIDDFILHQQVDFTSYEEACEAAIKYYLENLI